MLSWHFYCISVHWDFFCTRARAFPWCKPEWISLAEFCARDFLPLLCHKWKRFQWQNEFVRFRRVLVKREISLLNHSKWELLGVIIKKREKRKRNWKGVLIFRLFKSVILLGFYSEKKNLMFSWHYKTKTNPNC